MLRTKEQGNIPIKFRLVQKKISVTQKSCHKPHVRDITFHQIQPTPLPPTPISETKPFQTLSKEILKTTLMVQASESFISCGSVFNKRNVKGSYAKLTTSESADTSFLAMKHST